MIKKLILGAIISGVLVYFSVQGIDWKAVAEGFRVINYLYLAPVVLLLVFLQVLRSYRWGLILSPIKKIHQFVLFSVTSVGFLALVAIPARIGELARPYLISKKTGIKMTAALGTVFIERILDGLTVLSFFFIILIFVPLPSWLIKASVAFLLFTLVILICLLLLILRRAPALKVFDTVTSILPERWHKTLNELIHHFIDGIEMILDIKLIVSAAMLSIVIWILDISAIYFLFLAFGMKLSITAAVIVMVVLIIGIALPAAPGFVGNWHFFCIAGLALFGINKAEALTYAIVLHAVSLGVIVVLGLLFLPFNKFHLSDLKNGQNRS